MDTTPARPDREAAAEIAAMFPDAPGWLARAIETALTLIQAELRNACYAADRRALTKKLKQGRDGLILLCEALRDHHVRMAIFRVWPEADLNFDQLISALQDQAPNFDAAFVRALEYSAPGSGKDRIGVHFHGQDAEWACAALAVSLWRTVRPEPPKPGADLLTAICARLWRAAGGAGTRDWRWRMKAVDAALKAGAGSPAGQWLQKIQEAFDLGKRRNSWP